MIRGEIDLRAVAGPGYVAVVVMSARKLPGSDLIVSSARRGHDPDVLRVLCIKITWAIQAIHGARDYADIALVLLFRLAPVGRRWTRGRFGSARRGRLLFYFRKLFGVGAVRQGDGFSVRRPLRLARPSGQGCKLK